MWRATSGPTTAGLDPIHTFTNEVNVEVTLVRVSKVGSIPCHIMSNKIYENTSGASLWEEGANVRFVMPSQYYASYDAYLLPYAISSSTADPKSASWTIPKSNTAAMAALSSILSTPDVTKFFRPPTPSPVAPPLPTSAPPPLPTSAIPGLPIPPASVLQVPPTAFGATSTLSSMMAGLTTVPANPAAINEDGFERKVLWADPTSALTLVDYTTLSLVLFTPLAYSTANAASLSVYGKKGQYKSSLTDVNAKDWGWVFRKSDPAAVMWLSQVTGIDVAKTMVPAPEFKKGGGWGRGGGRGAPAAGVASVAMPTGVPGVAMLVPFRAVEEAKIKTPIQLLDSLLNALKMPLALVSEEELPDPTNATIKVGYVGPVGEVHKKVTAYFEAYPTTSCDTDVDADLTVSGNRVVVLSRTRA